MRFSFLVELFVLLVDVFAVVLGRDPPVVVVVVVPQCEKGGVVFDDVFGADCLRASICCFAVVFFCHGPWGD